MHARWLVTASVQCLAAGAFAVPDPSGYHVLQRFKLSGEGFWPYVRIEKRR